MQRRGLTIGSGRIGYYNVLPKDPIIHSLSARGIKQPQYQFATQSHNLGGKVKILKIGKRWVRQLPDEDRKFYQFYWYKNKGNFYRGTADGKGLGYGVMGDGLYVAYDEGMAKAFAQISSEQSGGTPKVEVIKLPKDLKLLNYKSPTMWKIKESLGVGKWDNVADPIYAKLLTEKIKRLGYDGVISDNTADGIVIFDKTKGGKFNLAKYEGKWYQVASNPAWFQKGCTDTTAEYTDKGSYVEVKNSCLKDGKRDTRLAKAYKVGDSKLEVDFVGGRVFTGNYNIVHYDKDYKNAIVSSNGYLWFLSRNKNISQKDYSRLVNIAKQKGLDVTKLKKGGKFAHIYSFDNVGRKDIKTVMMSPDHFLRETYREFEEFGKGEGESFEQYLENVIHKPNKEFLKKAIPDKKKRVPIPFLEYDMWGRVIGHEGRHTALASKEIGLKTIPVTIEKRRYYRDWEKEPDPSYKSKFIPIEKFKGYRKQPVPSEYVYPQDKKYWYK